jgi:DNA-binding NarL/FixJ family response regulator
LETTLRNQETDRKTEETRHNTGIYSLTEREKELLQLMVKGLLYKQIAADIFITLQTLNSMPVY